MLEGLSEGIDRDTHQESHYHRKQIDLFQRLPPRLLYQANLVEPIVAGILISTFLLGIYVDQGRQDFSVAVGANQHKGRESRNLNRLAVHHGIDDEINYPRTVWIKMLGAAPALTAIMGA